MTSFTADNTSVTADTTVYTADATTVAASSINVAFSGNGGVASASSTNTSSNFQTSNANDGTRDPTQSGGWSYGGGWNDDTNSVFPDTFDVTFNAVYTIGEIDIISLKDNFSTPGNPTPTDTFTLYGLTSFVVQYWDGSAFQTLYTTTNNNLVWAKITFAPVATNRIHLIINDSADHTWSRLVEIEAWTAAAVAGYVDFTGNLGGASLYGRGAYGRGQYSRTGAFAPSFSADLSIVGTDYFDGNLAPVVTFAGALAVTRPLAGDLAPVVTFAGDLSLIPYVDFAGDLQPQVVFGGYLELAVAFAGDLSPQIDLLGASLSLDLALGALDGSFGFTVVYAASGLVSGPLWDEAEPCPLPPWVSSKPCPPPVWASAAPCPPLNWGPTDAPPPPLWTPDEPCDPVEWTETEKCNG